MEKDSTKPLGRVIRIDESEIRGHLDKLVRGTVEKTLNALLEAEVKIPKLCKQTFETAIIERWRGQKIEGRYAYVYLDGIVLKRSWGEKVKNVSVLAAIGVDDDGMRRVLAVSEGH